VTAKLWRVVRQLQPRVRTRPELFSASFLRALDLPPPWLHFSVSNLWGARN